MKFIKIRKLSYQKARKEVEGFFVRSLSKGVTKVDVLDVSAGLKISGTQVEKIFRDFIKEGRVDQA